MVKHPNDGFAGKASKCKPQNATGGNRHQQQLNQTPVAGTNGKKSLLEDFQSCVRFFWSSNHTRIARVFSDAKWPGVGLYRAVLVVRDKKFCWVNVAECLFLVS